MDSDIRVIRVGVPGPSGTGVTLPAWATIRADVDELLAEIPRGVPQLNGAHVISVGSFAAPAGSTMGAPQAAISGLSSTKKHRIIARGSVKVTPAASKWVTFAAQLLGVSSGSAKVSPTGVASVQRVFGLWDIAPGPTSYTVGIYYQTSDATAALYENVDIEVEVIPFD